jgi:hypothetical protein
MKRLESGGDKRDWAVYRVLMRPPAHTDPPTTARNTSSLSSGFAEMVSDFTSIQFAAEASREILKAVPLPQSDPTPIRGGRLGLRKRMAIFSAHTASPLPPS